MRLQGDSYGKIEAFLKQKGVEYHIPAATLCRNLVRAFGTEQDFMPVYEELAEERGGEIAFDARRSLVGQVLVQRTRIDYMVRQEASKRKTRPGYSNPRIRQEMETLMQLVDSAAKYDGELAKDAANPTKTLGSVSDQAQEAIAEMILNGQIALPDRKASLKLVSGG
jgi:hypothetical protein